jgi:hypothetical protein
MPIMMAPTVATSFKVLPTRVIGVDADASGHAPETEDVHRKGEDLGADEQEPELGLADLLVQE